MDKPKLPLEEAIEKAGSQQALADLISRPDRKVSQQNVSWWLKESGGTVPADVVIPIEEATGVSRHRLAPNVFGAADHQQAPIKAPKRHPSPKQKRAA